MNATLRKQAAGVVLAYADGTEAQTLVGLEFALDRTDDGYSLTIDLSGNLLARNRGLLCYYEAQGLLQQHAQLKTIRLSDKDVARALEKELRTTALLQLRLLMGEGKQFSYMVNPQIAGRTVTLTVAPSPETEPPQK